MKSLLTTVALAGMLAAAPALAQQEGLVNVSLDDNNVQVPIGVAAQACGIDANVIAEQSKNSDDAICEIDQDTAAEHNIGGQGGNNGAQKGLVNVSVDGNNVQVPVGVAAQVCDIDANVIAQQKGNSDEALCDIDQATAAEHNIGG